jgi:hypothetical protein
MTALSIAGIGVCATGMANWTQAQPVLRAVALPPLDPLPRQVPACLPPVERRRANATSRLAVSAAMQAVEGVAVEDVARLASVFSSSDGDGEVLASMLAALAQPQVVLSPTLFHNSVFNAPAGYWSIGSGAVAASITVCAGVASFAAGLREAHAQIVATGAPVLYVACDAPFPEALASFARSAKPFACALRLAPAPSHGLHGTIELRMSMSDGVPAPQSAELSERFAGNAAAEVIPLLVAIARGQPGRISLPYLDGTRMPLDYRPC